MALRVVAGSAGGLFLKTPRGSDLRPTQDRIKQAIFSTLGERVPGARVLDLYAGTGALGIEALSRGSASAVFVEKDRAGCRCIAENLAHCRLAQQGTVLHADALAHLRGTPHPFDLIFADPPYEKTPGVVPPPLASLLHPWIAPGGAFIWEFFSGRPFQTEPGWKTLFHRKYGETSVAILTPGP